MEQFLGALGLVAVILLILRYFHDRGKGKPQSARISSQEIYRAAAELNSFYQSTAHPKDLAGHSAFRKGVRLLAGSGEDLPAYIQGDNPVLACMALEGLLEFEDPQGLIRARLPLMINTLLPWPRYFALKALAHHTPASESIIGPLLLNLDSSWGTHPSYTFLRDFIVRRLAGGESPAFGEQLKEVADAQATWLLQLLTGMALDPLKPLIEGLQQWQRLMSGALSLRSIGRIWKAAEGPESVIEHPALIDAVKMVEQMLTREQHRSVVLVGESGVGKTAMVRQLAAKLGGMGWTVFEAGHAELLAGQVFVGQLEDRVKTLVQQLVSYGSTIWYIPDFHLLSWTGRHHQSPVGVLDYLLPYIERGELRILGETTTGAFEQLAKSHPRCMAALQAIRIEPLARAASLDIAQQWARCRQTSTGAPLILAETLNEASLLAEQYLGHKALPGSLLELLKMTRDRLADGKGGTPDTIGLDDLIVTLTELTGLPASLLDERMELSTVSLRRLFEQRVLGQPEAIDCLVERMAMIKAGLTDPTRPLGVFLFAGPTGSGKTQIAKVLTEYLFGSPQRMIRLDMSEFQTPESLSRIIGDPYAAEAGALVDEIRKQPFSVVLLDEFEKAHPRVWDLFLQVFDDGRLTDRRGNTADCRHALFIMTSNLGSAVPVGLRLGFTREALHFNPEEVRQIIGRTFHKEFLNRIDRVVIFRPLSRDSMREILRMEMDEAFKRRGLRSRTWALVWEDDALEFLLEKGFTVDLGARPLKRAVDTYLLTPIAMAIVGRQFPEGDQFLYVKRAGERLEVEFVDPDAPEEKTAEPVAEPAAPPAAGEESVGVGPAAILLDAKGTAAEIESLLIRYGEVGRMLGSEFWEEKKQLNLALMAQFDFWSSADRFSILGEVEYMDRIQAGFETAGSLLHRLQQSGSNRRASAPRHLVEKLAQQLYLIEAACDSVRDKDPRDAFLWVEAAREAGAVLEFNNQFAAELDRMYQAWARKRRMNFKVLRRNEGNGNRPYRMLAAVSGYAAYRILERERGFHLFEEPQGERSFRRAKAQVLVEPQPDEPTGAELKDWCEQADKVMAAVRVSHLAVVRRYRREPSPLVRDSVRKWRTGRIHRVLGGDFDLFA